MDKTMSIILAIAISLSLAACGVTEKPGSVEPVSGSDAVQFTSSSSQEQQPAQQESPAAGVGNVPDGTPSTQAGVRPGTSEARSVWVSFLELERLMLNKSSSEFRAGIAETLQTSADFGLNTVVLHVRPFGDAIYPSEFFPQSYLFTGEEGDVGKVPYDALGIAIEEASKCGMRVEAWINPYRVRSKPDRAVGSDNPVQDMLADGDAVKMGDVITYNPASTKAQELIVAGVTELIKNYDISGIHFDDYFYPTTDAAFDSSDYSAYKASGGTKDLAAWRRSNVTELVRRVHDAIAATDSSVVFGISPQGNMGNNMNNQFVDLEEIIKAGLIDYVCPQMYFGFKNEICPYSSTIKLFNDMTKGTDVKVYAGLATYKFGIVDSWAGSGKEEWVDTTDILKRQVELARELSCYGGFVLFRYDTAFNYKTYFSEKSVHAQVQTELDNLQMLLK